ncbi:kallikrein-7-like, partial [Myotis lucifugus]|uniref:kallikrein-7-like n=1 Tax=Myotis lucifugus TaxID=59463 RepID=UPI0003C4CCF7
MRVEVECQHLGLAASGVPDKSKCSTGGPSSVAATEAQTGLMAGPLVQPLLLLLLSFALGSAGQEEYFIHPRYNNRTNNHDIMLVKLHSPATLSPTVNTIYLPSSCKGSGTSCTVSGWGITTKDGATKPSELMCSNVNIISAQECKQSYRALLRKYMLCAAAPNGLSNSCK